MDDCRGSRVGPSATGDAESLARRVLSWCGMTIVSLRPSALAPLCVALLCACPGKSEGDTDTPDTSGSTSGASTDPTGGGEAVRPNWHEDIAPVVAEHCQSCHVDGGIAPFSMETYALTKDWAGLMASDVAAGIMPPWHAIETAECDPGRPWKHDARLAPELKDLFQKWSDAGAPEGDPKLAAPLPTPPSLDLPNPTKTVTMTGSLTIDKVGTTLDQFHCISLDPGNAEDVYLTGMQVIPGNRRIAHHVVIYVDETGESASWQDGLKKDCGGGPGLSGGSRMIGAWVPGGLPMEPPTDVGIPLKAGSRLVFNMHYHATGGGPEIDDKTGLAMRWTTTAPAWISLFELLGEPGNGDSLTPPLLIPAGEKDHVEEYTWTVSNGGSPFPDAVEARVWTIGPHMHKIATSMRVWVEDRDTAADSCLVEAPKYDYNWQRLYAYDGPLDQMLRVKAGDKIHVRCVFDNTLDNPGVVEALAEVGLKDPIDVAVGEGTLDEMCIGGIGVAIKTP